MSTVQSEVRTGAYYDSVVLMQLQRSLADLPGVLDAGVVMGTPANKELLEQSGLLTDAARQAAVDDLVIVVKTEDASAARTAIAQVDDLLAKRRSQTASEYRPRSLHAAVQMLPDAHWVLVSVPGRYAAGVAEEALDLDKNVFLYSDNVSLDDEIQLKTRAAEKGLLVMGPDCGTAIVNGVGLGFANKVRRGSIGIVAASGTGLQAVSVGIHRLGGGVSHALGTGGRDLSEAVGAITARQGLELLADDPDTEVIVLISKPPAPSVADQLLAAARQIDKPVVVNFIGYRGDEASKRRGDEHSVYFAHTLDEAAEVAVKIAATKDERRKTEAVKASEETAGHKATSFVLRPSSSVPRLLRGLYSGGTLAYEALFILQEYLPTIYSNAPLPGGLKLANPHESQGHTVVDLGEDEFTVGRLHPMMDNDLRVRRLHEEAEDPETAVILLDVVLGYGAHPDPAGELGPAIADAIAAARAAGRELTVVAVVVGTDDDPQDLAAQVKRLEQAGAVVFSRHDEAVRAVGALLATDDKAGMKDERRKTKDEGRWRGSAERSPTNSRLSSSVLRPLSSASFAAINVGLESFTDSLTAQGASVVHVDWKPPAGGNEKLMGILARMRRK